MVKVPFYQFAHVKSDARYVTEVKDFEIFLRALVMFAR